VAPGSKIVSVKVLDHRSRFCCSSDVIAGLDWILNNRPDVRVVNMSLGTFDTFLGDCDEENAVTMAFAEVIDQLTERGVAVFAASGNAGWPDRLKAPACVANTISVGATDKLGSVALFSQSGLNLDLLAPGVSIRSARRLGTTDVRTGTSMATPHASGAAALRSSSTVATSPARFPTKSSGSESRPSWIPEAPDRHESALRERLSFRDWGGIRALTNRLP
jgi:subtilisin family serine protease